MGLWGSPKFKLQQQAMTRRRHAPGPSQRPRCPPPAPPRTAPRARRAAAAAPAGARGGKQERRHCSLHRTLGVAHPVNRTPSRSSLAAALACPAVVQPIPSSASPSLPPKPPSFLRVRSCKQRSAGGPGKVTEGRWVWGVQGRGRCEVSQCAGARDSWSQPAPPPHLHDLLHGAWRYHCSRQREGTRKGTC